MDIERYNTKAKQFLLVLQLAFPAIMSQITSTLMEYVDTSMVGRLGANSSGAIGLVTSTTWLFGGMCGAATIGFTVQVAHRLGAKDEKGARNVMSQGIISVLFFSAAITIISAIISRQLPHWLGGSPEICKEASTYFLIYMLAIPAFQLSSICGGMLQSSGNMKLPATLNIASCFLNVILNACFIFPTEYVSTPFGSILKPGLGLGVAGAALATAISEITVAILLLISVLFVSNQLHLRKGERLIFSLDTTKKAIGISLPIAFENFLMCGAYVASTRIVAPLGTIAIAAHSFSITAEGLCYMPGYGIGQAATTLVGQAYGARRNDLVRRFSYLSVMMGVGIMTIIGMLMYNFAPFMIGLLSPNADIRALGAAVLRIEAFAEPLYATSIVCSGSLRGQGNTLVPSILNFASMWFIRIPLSIILTVVFSLGLRGVWIAMAIELCCRGLMMLTWLIHVNQKTVPLNH